MADLFNPKFVDLVRNYTTSVGTGDFKLGPAVNGYTGFAAACAVGDSFYYSAIGIDKPAEREVGRGTLLADGAISREPVSGAKTNFSSGTKTVALIAAAEWFDAAQKLVASVTPTGLSVASAPTPADARTALGLGAASLLDSDADAALSSNSDARVPTQRAIKAYVDAHGGAGLAAMADRAALQRADSQAAAAILREAGREGTFVFDGSDLSAKVAADTVQGIYVAPASDPTGASGAWVRKFEGPINPEWFGFVAGDDSANSAANVTAMAGLRAVLAARSIADAAQPTIVTVEPVRFPAKVYWLGDSGTGACLDCDFGTVRFEGAGVSGSVASRGTVLKIPAGTVGIRTHTATTTGASGNAGSHPSSAGSSFANLTISGPALTTKAESENHLFHGRAQVNLQNVSARFAEGEGIFLDSANGGAVNDSSIINCSSLGCRNGLKTTGNDANAMRIIGWKGQSNRQWDYWDNATFGSGVSMAECSSTGTNSWGTGIPGAVCSYGGKLYFVIAGQEAAASVNEPSGDTTSTAYWAYWKAGAATADYPAWVSGMAWRAGGTFHTDSVNAKGAMFIACYDEYNGALAQIPAPAQVVGGFLSISLFQGYSAGWGPAASLKVTGTGSLQTGTSVTSVNGTVTASLGNGAFGNPGCVALSFSEPTAAPSGYALLCRTDLGDIRFTYNLSTAFLNMPFVVQGPNTTRQNGTGASAPHRMWIPQLIVGPAGASAGSAQENSRRIMIDNAAPTTTAHAVGDWMLDRAGASGLIGRKCTAAGTPGTWVDQWSGYGASQIGYASGAGGAVAQATSKATGVTLNKLCGQVTMNAAALPAGAAVAFTLTNSQIAATNIVLVTIASGASSNSYLTQVEATATGSCRIQLRNISAGSLSEAVVLNFAVLKAVAA